MINFVIRPPEIEKEEEIIEDLAVLKQKEADLQAMLHDVQGAISEQEKDKQ